MTLAILARRDLHLAAPQIRHARYELRPGRLTTRVFSTSYGCPDGQCVIFAASARRCFPESPRRQFTERVTGSRCDGRTQRRTRHRWSRSESGAIGPTSSRYASTCAFALRLRTDTQNCPYPRVKPATHSQHGPRFTPVCEWIPCGPSLFTFAQKRDGSFVVSSVIIGSSRVVGPGRRGVTSARCGFSI